MPRLSTRVLSLKPSATLAIAARAKALARQGVKVVNFSLGEPDFDTPAPARRAAAKAIEAGQTHYAPTLGDPETRGVVAEKLARENGLAGITGDHVAISSGAKHSLHLVLHCLLDGRDAADEVLLPTPSWVSYAPITQLAGGRVVELPTTPETDFKISPAQLRAAITPRSRVLMLNTPSNPCGTMYTPAELRALAAVVAEAARGVAPELVIVVDEIYEKIVFGGIEHLSIGSLPEVAERAVTINGLSKAFAMTGWRVGYAACPGAFGLGLIKAIDNLQGQMTSCIPAFILPAIRAALTECGAETEAMRKAFALRARLIYDLAQGIPGLRCPRPTGAFYLFPDVSAFFGKTTPSGTRITDSLSFGEALLNEAHVAVVPGVEFGACASSHIRISFACAENDIEAGMAAIAGFMESLR